MKSERLDKIVACVLQCGRKEAGKLIRSGEISVDGIVRKDPSLKIFPDKERVTLSGKELCFKKNIYIMMNKPAGVVSSTDDGDVTVIDILPEELMRRGLFPAGRLDKDTTGFVLITDDGDFAHRILSPKSHVDKEYEVMLAEPLEDGAEEKFGKGLTLGDGYQCLPAQTQCIDGGERLKFKVVLHEGKYHQIKRMFASCGNRVVSLHRTAMGGVRLDSMLKEGESRELTAEELERLMERH